MKPLKKYVFICCIHDVVFILPQVPVLILVSRVWMKDFHFIFNDFSAIAILFSVLIYNYLSIDGRSNYFEGFALITLYALLTVAFYYLQFVG